MKRFISKTLSLLLAAAMLTGCANAGSDSEGNNSGINGSGNTGGNSEEDNLGTSGSGNSHSTAGENSQNAAEPVKVDFSQTDTDMFTKRDAASDYDKENSILIRLNGSSVTASSDSVKISGTTVTITENTTHIITGTLNDGMIIVDAGDDAKLQLVLDGAEIHSETSAPLYVLNADKVFVTLAGGTENTLSNGGTFTAVDENNIDSVIFSKQDLTFNGTGTLNIDSPTGHGIVSKDDLVITGGTYNVISASHGLDANDSVRITGDTSLTIDAGKDGIHSENSKDASLGYVYISDGTVKIDAEGDGISAEAYMQIESGEFDILAGGGSKNGTKETSDRWGGYKGGKFGGTAATMTDLNSSVSSGSDSSSMKGLKAEGGILISGGTIRVNSADDAIHSNTSVTINGGGLDIASGDDGVHADESLTITAGNINITESYEGLEGSSINISGGDISLTATDDGINAAGGMDASGITGGRDGMFGGKGGMSSGGGSLAVSGGNIYIKMGGDGLDSNGSMSVTGGNITVSGANSGDTSILDYDSSGIIGGGTFIGTGATSMAQNFGSASTQGSILVTTGTQSAGTEIKLSDPNGNVLVSYTADRDFSCVIISHPSVVSGGKYVLTAGSFSSDITMDGTVYGSGGFGGIGGNKGDNSDGDFRGNKGDKQNGFNGDRTSGKFFGSENTAAGDIV